MVPTPWLWSIRTCSLKVHTSRETLPGWTPKLFVKSIKSHSVLCSRPTDAVVVGQPQVCDLKVQMHRCIGSLSENCADNRVWFQQGVDLHHDPGRRSRRRSRLVEVLWVSNMRSCEHPKHFVVNTCLVARIECTYHRASWAKTWSCGYNTSLHHIKCHRTATKYWPCSTYAVIPAWFSKFGKQNSITIAQLKKLPADTYLADGCGVAYLRCRESSSCAGGLVVQHFD